MCTRCIMDTTDTDIIFDEHGFCNHCTMALNKLKEFHFKSEQKREQKLNEIVNVIKKTGKGKKYDCVIGLSGGIDSSYLAYVLVKQYGIRPLAVHVDNGWNSELAVMNIENIVKKLNIDLHTWVIDWDEFKELQKSFLRASVVDLEMLSDHAIIVEINRIARKKRIRYFLIGSNYQTESIMPGSWFYSNKHDSKNIKDIYKKYGNKRKIKTFSFLSFREYLFFEKSYVRYLTPLSFMDYNKHEAKAILQKEIDWQDYGTKHHESFITKFYQTYILPNKFGIDKRSAHLSSLICTNQITRESALEELKKPFFKDNNEEREAIEYFCKKMELSKEEFNMIMNEPIKSHWEFKSYTKRKQQIGKFIKQFTKYKK